MRQHRPSFAGRAATADGGELRDPPAEALPVQWDDPRYASVRVSGTSRRRRCSILRTLRYELRAGDALPLGTDTVKDEATLVRAYDDRDGVTAAFNLNILHRLNRELGANFDVGCFRHRARWNRVETRTEMRLESTREHWVNIVAASLAFTLRPLKPSIPRKVTCSLGIRWAHYWMMRASGSSRHGRIHDGGMRLRSRSCDSCSRAKIGTAEFSGER